MIARIIVGVWLLIFLVLIGVDVFSREKPPTYTPYQVLDKGQEYSYRKRETNLVNTLILKNLETGETESKQVTTETHWSSKVGETLQFKNNDRYLWLSVIYVIFSLASVLSLYLGGLIGAGVRWIFTGEWL